MIFNPEQDVWRPCSHEYSLRYADLDDNERRLEDHHAISREVDAQLPTIAAPATRPSRPTDVDFVWLGGLVAYALVGALILWGILAANNVGASRTLAILAGVVGLSPFVAHWRHYHASQRRAYSAALVEHERQTLAVAQRDRERAELATRLWQAKWPGHERPAGAARS